MSSFYYAAVFIILSGFRFPVQLQSSIVVPNDTPEYWYQAGDLLLGYLANVHGPGDGDELCGEGVSQSGVHLTEAVAFAVREVNRRRDILPNITLGFVMVDGCHDAQAALARSVYFLQDRNTNRSPIEARNGTSNITDAEIEQDEPEKEWNFGVVGIIGPGLSSQAVPVARLLSVFELPMISDSASSDELSDSSTFEYFLSLVPGDRMTAEALVETVSHYQWEYVVVLYSTGGQWTEIANTIEERLRHRDICVAFSHVFSSFPEQVEIDFIMGEFRKYSKARVIISLLSDYHLELIRMPLEHDDDDDITRHLWLFGYPDDLIETFELMPEHSLYVRPVSSNVPRFNDYFNIRKPWTLPENPWLRRLWEQGYECTFSGSDHRNVSGCHLEGSFTGMPGYVQPQHTWDLSRIYDSIYAMADSLHRLITHQCRHAFAQPSKASACVTGDQLLAYLQSSTFSGLNGPVSFNNAGEPRGKLLLYQTTRPGEELPTQFTQVGTFDTETQIITISDSKVKFPNPLLSSTEATEGGDSQSLAFLSVCKATCPFRHINVRDTLPCCWRCEVCKTNQVIVENETSYCQSCPVLYWPDETGLTCQPIPHTHLQWTSLYELLILGLAMLEVVTVVVLGLVILAQSDHKLIRSTGFGLNNLIVFGVLISCATVPLLTREPSHLSCVIQKILFHTGCSFLYATLFVRVVFLRYSVMETGVNMISTKSTSLQAALAVGLIFIQVSSVFIVIN